MTREEIIAKLIEHRAELEAAGAEHVSLFGSVARGEHGPDSDIDVLVRLSDAVIESGWGYFGALSDLQEMIKSFTGRDVDVVSEPIRKERFRENVERERVVAY